LAPKAAVQYRLVTRAQIRDTGATDEWFRWHVKSGVLRALEPTVFLLPGHESTWTTEAIWSHAFDAARRRVSGSEAPPDFGTFPSAALSTLGLWQPELALTPQAGESRKSRSETHEPS
jgi:hypothetical protein